MFERIMMRGQHETLIHQEEKKSLWFFIFSTIAILGSLALFFSSNRKIDSEHRAILFSRNEAIHATHSLLLQSSHIHRALLNLIITKDTSEMRLMRNRIIHASDSTTQAFSLIENSLSSADEEEKKNISDLKNAFSNYQVSFQTYLNLITRGDTNAAKDFRVTCLRLSLDLYQTCQERLLLNVTTDAIEQSNDVSEKYSRNNWIFLALGVSPYLFFLFAIFYYVLVIRRR